jgi:tRNA threonylcarbamoyladenosine modification (KEOPS) complex  Pcc1 subunit
MDGFTDRSGIIRFVVDDDKIQLEINAVAATEAKLTISSKLLRLAQVVQPVGR